MNASMDSRFSEMNASIDARFTEMNSNVNNRINDLRNQMTREHDILADKVDTLTDTVKAHIDDPDLHRDARTGRIRATP